MSPVFSTLNFICGSVPTNSKCRFCSSLPLSRCSSIRNEGPLGDTLEQCVQEPSTPQMKDPVPFVSIIRVHPTVASYSAHPPSTPLYLMPISSTFNEPNRFNNLQQISKIKVHSNSKKIVKKVLRSVLNTVLLTIASNEFAKSRFEAPVNATKTYQQKLCDVAIQTRAFNLTNRYCSSEYEDSSNCSDSREGVGATGAWWGGQVRALRDSHVRLVLRQLRQLRDIDRLDRALRLPAPPLHTT